MSNESIFNKSGRRFCGSKMRKEMKAFSTKVVAGFVVRKCEKK